MKLLRGFEKKIEISEFYFQLWINLISLKLLLLIEPYQEKRFLCEKLMKKGIT
jgi:hypothetical protein